MAIMKENYRKNGQWINPQRILYPKITQTNHEKRFEQQTTKFLPS